MLKNKKKGKKEKEKKKRNEYIKEKIILAGFKTHGSGIC
jgi:hypothetical protein